jgi:hypothetical protein
MNCNVCGVELDNTNWLLSRQNRKSYICKICENSKNNNRYNKNRDKYLINNKNRYQEIKEEVFSYYGGKCNICGQRDHSLLSLDHLEGNGRQHRKSILRIDSGTGFHKWVCKNKPNNLRLLCYNCNCRIDCSKILLNISFCGNICKYCGDENIYRNNICNKCYQINKRNKYIDLKIEIFNEYGGHCNNCEIDNIEYLTIDHINNNGGEHRKIIGLQIYPWLKRNNYPKDNFQILCFNCNYLKRDVK